MFAESPNNTIFWNVRPVFLLLFFFKIKKKNHMMFAEIFIKHTKCES